MKEFIVQHIELISTIVGVIFFAIMINLFEYFNNTKFEEIHRGYFIVLLIVGLVVTSQTIGKWLIK